MIPTLRFGRVSCRLACLCCSLPGGTGINKIATAVVNEPDGTKRHVTTCVHTKDGEYNAKIYFLTSSTYALIYNQVDFADVSDKRYPDIIRKMASTEILFGRGDGVLKSDPGIMRTRFATVLVWAIGLSTDGI